MGCVHIPVMCRNVLIIADKALKSLLLLVIKLWNSLKYLVRLQAGQTVRCFKAPAQMARVDFRIAEIWKCFLEISACQSKIDCPREVKIPVFMKSLCCDKQQNRRRQEAETKEHTAKGLVVAQQGKHPARYSQGASSKCAIHEKMTEPRWCSTWYQAAVASQSPGPSPTSESFWRSLKCGGGDDSLPSYLHCFPLHFYSPGRLCCQLFSVLLKLLTSTSVLHQAPHCDRPWRCFLHRILRGKYSKAISFPLWNTPAPWVPSSFPRSIRTLFFPFFLFWFWRSFHLRRGSGGMWLSTCL